MSLGRRARRRSPGGTNVCSGLLTSKAFTVRIKWTPTNVHLSSVRFSGFQATADQAGDAGFALPGTGHRVTVKGSFAGTDKGASSMASVFSDESSIQAVTTCGQATGLASLTVASGQVSLG